MSELKRYEIDPDYPNNIVGGIYYDADEVDAAIGELKRENERLKKKMDEYHLMSDIRRVKIKELKRALWLARAERAKEMCQRLLIQGFDPKWEEVERKCRAKAEEYK